MLKDPAPQGFDRNVVRYAKLGIPEYFIFHHHFVSSVDGGVTWAWKPGPEWADEMVVHPGDAKVAVVSGDQAVFVTRDGERRWEKKTGTWIRGLRFDPRPPHGSTCSPVAACLTS
ncbi:MAG: hypothetical protein RJA70_911 [Pseudomonadota bacterium]|jgi:hypothetical protein